MLLDFEVRACSRKCATTERVLQPGDVYFSVLAEQGNGMQRHDYSVEAWEGPPEVCIGWWRSKIPGRDGGKPKLAPTEVMLNLLTALAKRPEDQEFRYLLSLLLLRRRKLRREEVIQSETGNEVLVLSCPRRNEQYEVIVAEPDAPQAKLVQQRMIDLLYGEGEITTSADSDVQSDTSNVSQ